MLLSIFFLINSCTDLFTVQINYGEKMSISSELPKKQSELRTKSGKRRIQPAFIASVTVPEAEITTAPTSVEESSSNKSKFYRIAYCVLL